MGERDRSTVIALILIAEDHAPLRRLMADVLRIEGYDVIEAADGAAALALLDTHAPDAIVLNLHMPVLDGRAFYQRLRAGERPHGTHTPVLVTSAARDLARDTQDGLDGAPTLAQPFDIDVLVHMVRDLVEPPASPPAPEEPRYPLDPGGPVPDS